MTRKPAPPTAVKDRRVTVVGLGRFGGGVGVTRWLAGQGAVVTVSDKADASQLAESVAAIEDLDVTLHLGEHLLNDFTKADLLVVNPAIPKNHPLLAAAAEASVPRTSEINLFMECCDAPIVGITGTVGKSTTTAMTGKVLAERFTTHVGGNIGKSLLEDLPNIEPDHVVVLELSSFQLEDLPIIARSPNVALVTNILPNHLDRHGEMHHYAQAKKNIFRFQGKGDTLILNRADEEMAAWAAEAPHDNVEYFDPDPAEPFELLVPGRHNQANAQAAWTVAKKFGVGRGAAEDVLREFAGLEHRLQFVSELNGVRYYNDSKCTTPAGAVVALESFPPRSAIMLLGGSDKGVSFAELGAALAERARGVVAFGATRGAILAAVEKARIDRHLPETTSAADLPAAVEAAEKFAHSGTVVLLCPACASYDQFVNYEQRGEAFIELVTLP
jgi:UDP-N-acetylmuramoylalanine--D-glutamate ligase